MSAQPSYQPAPAPAPRIPDPRVRAEVQNLLTRSQAFNEMPPDRQREVAKNTALVADYLAAPEGIPGNRIAGGVGNPAPARAMDDPAPQDEDYETARKAVTEIGNERFRADAAREGADAMKLMNKSIGFPTFVGGLIQGVFAAIVRSSIEQMEAYSKMIADVAKSLGQFMEDNVTPNQGRDHMVDMFPDVFDIGTGDDFSESPDPRLMLKDGVDESSALKRVNSSITFDNGALKSLDLSDENVEMAIVTAARMQLAKQRQQLMASLVLMGINRIVVTDGRISAKMLIEVQSRDGRKMSRSAAAYDYARDQHGNIQSTRSGDETYERNVNQSGQSTGWGNYRSTGEDYSYEGYAKGTSKYEEKPVMTASSAATEASEASLQMRSQLAGNVEVNFKSDYLPLDKMATPGMIAAIQGNSTPVDPNVLPSAKTAPPAVGTVPAGAAAPTAGTPATGP